MQKMDVASQSSEVEVVEIIDESTQFLWDIDDEGDKEEREKIEEEERLALENRENLVVIGTPNYKSDFTGFLMEKEFCIETGKHIKNDSTPRRTCFNCLGDHNISECKVPRNPSVIARNRMKIMGKRSANVRYHEDGENKYGHFQPGKISTNLREALRLKEFQAPEFIYRMRILGYPPGWLKEAEVQRSSVLLIDECGKEVSHPDDEEGETDVCMIKYQPEKLISYPGFNIPFPEHIEDEYRNLNYPPMQEGHSRDNFLKYMKLNKADLSFRKKLKEDKNLPIISSTPQLGDMDLDDGETVDSTIEVNNSADEEIKKEEGELSEDSNESTNDEKLDTDSQLKLSSPSSNNDFNPERSSEDSEPFSKQPKEDEAVSLKRSLENESSDNSVSSTSVTVKKYHRSSSKGFTLGVCIPDSITPFTELPDATKWSVDVSDHILFDNLPDSTGTWQKIKGIVKNVQSEMQKLSSQKST